jgi:hypothetical protein
MYTEFWWGDFSGNDHLKDQKGYEMIAFKVLNFQVLLPSVFTKKLLMQVEAT